MKRLALVTTSISTKVVDSKAVGEKVRQRRRRVRKTLAFVAEATGLSVSYLSALERGTRQWSQSLLDQVQDVLDD